MQTILTAFLAIAGFLVVFPAMWIGIVWLISRLSGWAGMARQFAHPAPVNGEVFSMCSARFRFMSNYSSVLTVTVNDTGFHIKTMIFFRIGHEPLFIPWSAVESLSPRNFWLASAIRVHLRPGHGGGAVNFTLYGWGRKMADRLEHTYQKWRMT